MRKINNPSANPKKGIAFCGDSPTNLIDDDRKPEYTKVSVTFSMEIPGNSENAMVVESVNMRRKALNTTRRMSDLGRIAMQIAMKETDAKNFQVVENNPLIVMDGVVQID